jgi:hypothetical protein
MATSDKKFHDLSEKKLRSNNYSPLLFRGKGLG